MNSVKIDGSDTADREISVTRLVNAPRELVWKVWTEPEHIVNWWGPRGFTNTNKSMEVKPGGKWIFTMHGPDGTDYENVVIYHEIVKPEYLRYDHGEPGEETYFQVRVNFREVGDKTEVSVVSLFDTAERRNFVIEKYGAEEGLKQNIDKLEEYLAAFVNF